MIRISSVDPLENIFAFWMQAFSSKLISIVLNSSWTSCTVRSVFSKIIRPQSSLKPKEFASGVAAYKQRVLKLSFLTYVFNYHRNLQTNFLLKSNSHLAKKFMLFALLKAL